VQCLASNQLPLQMALLLLLLLLQGPVCGAGAAFSEQYAALARRPRPYDGVWAPWWWQHTHKSSGKDAAESVQACLGQDPGPGGHQPTTPAVEALSHETASQLLEVQSNSSKSLPRLHKCGRRYTNCQRCCREERGQVTVTHKQ